METRKLVTVIFCDLVGSTELGASIDAESLRRVMTRYYDEMRAVRRTTRRHGREVHRGRGGRGLRHPEPPRGRRGPRGPRGDGDAGRTGTAQRGARQSPGACRLRHPHRRQLRRGRRDRLVRRAIVHGRRSGEPGRPAGTGGGGRRDPAGRGDARPGPRRRDDAAHRAAHAEGPRRRRRPSPARGDPGRGGTRAPARLAVGRPGARVRAVAGDVRADRSRTTVPALHRPRRGGGGEVPLGRGIRDDHGRARRHRPRAVPPVRRGDHVLADPRDRHGRRRTDGCRRSRRRPGARSPPWSPANAAESRWPNASRRRSGSARAPAVPTRPCGRSGRSSKSWRADGRWSSCSTTSIGRSRPCST